ncbi:MAG: acetylglutamate kinase [Planctomycetota bacterium]
MRLCLKLGGRLLEQAEGRARLAREIAALRAEGARVLVVHGGGARLGEVGRRLGLEERRHEGLRITDADTARAACWILGGELNKALVASLVAEGVPALGLCGADLGLFRPRRKRAEGVDLGYVGELDPADVDGDRLHALLELDLVPVLATIGPERDAADPDQPLLNVNADEAAGPLAAAAGVGEVLFLSDVAGVLGADRALLPALDPGRCLELIATGVVHGGMIPKVRAALDALEHGVPRARIASGEGERPVRAALAGGGTLFAAEPRGAGA